MTDKAHSSYIPDARTTRLINTGRMGPHGWMVPVYCVNCGADGGYALEMYTPFVFYLCEPCARTHGRALELTAVPENLVRGRSP